MLKVHTMDGVSLLIARPTGIVDAAVAEAMVAFVEIHEVKLESGFNRLCDLTAMDGIDLLTRDVRRLAHRRRAFNPNNIHVKAAFVATDPLAFGLARMYEQLLNSPRIEVRVWCDLRMAADWLDVEISRLTS